MGAAEQVSLVIPGRNCARTLEACLSAAKSLSPTEVPAEILYVDDASTDDSATIARRCGVRVLSTGKTGQAAGPGATRNVGWRAATHPLIWFIDADCVAEPDALALLLPHLDDPRVAGAGGSYGNMETQSLLAALIHEEIVGRHRRMPPRVDFLGSFNVLYRRTVLEAVGGFDERFLKAQDAELSWRLVDGGYELAFEPRSRVRHFHPVRWGAYLKTQRQQGFWRVQLYRRHRRRVRGDAYSGWLDHLQPPLSMMVLASLPLSLVPKARGISVVGLALLMLLQVPMTLRLLFRTRRPVMLLYGVMGCVRAFWRGWGMVQGMIRGVPPETTGEAAR